MVNAKTSTPKKTSTVAAPKSTPVKKSSPTRTVPVTQTEEKKEVVIAKTESGTTTLKTRRALNIKRSHIVIAGVIFVLLALAYLTRSWFVAATVNGQPISRIAVIEELEKSGGANALNTIVTKTLIAQEAKNKKVTVSNADVDAEIKTIEKRLSTQGQKLTEALTSANMTINDLKDQVRYQKLLEKMVGPVTVTDNEVTEYIEKNKASLPTGTNESDLNAQVKESLRQQKLNDKIQPFVQNLQSKARVSKWVSY